jgi:hypothetical protein
VESVMDRVPFRQSTPQHRTGRIDSIVHVIYLRRRSVSQHRASPWHVFQTSSLRRHIQTKCLCPPQVNWSWCVSSFAFYLRGHVLSYATQPDVRYTCQYRQPLRDGFSAMVKTLVGSPSHTFGNNIYTLSINK